MRKDPQDTSQHVHRCALDRLLREEVAYGKLHAPSVDSPGKLSIPYGLGLFNVHRQVLDYEAEVGKRLGQLEGHTAHPGTDVHYSGISERRPGIVYPMITS